MVLLASYNKVLNYLETSKIDVQWLNSFEENIEDKGSNYITTSSYDSCFVKNEGLQHDFSYGLNNTDNIVFNFNTDVLEVKLDRFQYLEVVLSTPQTLTYEDIELVFSRVPYCEIGYMSFKCSEELSRHNSSKKYGNLYTLVFDIQDSNDMEYDNKHLTDIQSVLIDLGEKVDVVVQDVKVRQTNFTLRVKDVDEQIVQAKKYILRKIREDEIPFKLESCITRITVAHLWLNKWYEEGQKSSTLGEFSTESYYDKLMEGVDGDIDAYNKDKGSSEDKRYLDSRWIGSR